MRCTREQDIKIAYVLAEYRSTKPVRRVVMLAGCGLNSRQGGERREDTKKADLAGALEC